MWLSSGDSDIWSSGASHEATERKTVREKKKDSEREMHRETDRDIQLFKLWCSVPALLGNRPH